MNKNDLEKNLPVMAEARGVVVSTEQLYRGFELDDGPDRAITIINEILSKYCGQYVHLTVEIVQRGPRQSH